MIPYYTTDATNASGWTQGYSTYGTITIIYRSDSTGCTFIDQNPPPPKLKVLRYLERSPRGWRFPVLAPLAERIDATMRSIHAIQRGHDRRVLAVPSVDPPRIRPLGRSPRNSGVQFRAKRR